MNDNTPEITHAVRIAEADGSVRAITLGKTKIPEPITMPITRAVASTTPSLRGKSCRTAVTVCGILLDQPPREYNLTHVTAQFHGNNDRGACVSAVRVCAGPNKCSTAHRPRRTEGWPTAQGQGAACGSGPQRRHPVVLLRHGSQTDR